MNSSTKSLQDFGGGGGIIPGGAGFGTE